MANPKTKTATYADIEALPPNVVGEILFGKLVVQPASEPRHAATLSAVGGVLGRPYVWAQDGPGGWIFMNKPEVRLGPHIVVPDVAGWKCGRLNLATDAQWVEEAPDWVCEVLSPATEASDRAPKRKVYHAYGIEYLWFADPRQRYLETFHRQSGGWLVTGFYDEHEEVTAPPFDAITFSLGLLWPFDPPPADSNAKEA